MHHVTSDSDKLTTEKSSNKEMNRNERLLLKTNGCEHITVKHFVSRTKLPNLTPAKIQFADERRDKYHINMQQNFYMPKMCNSDAAERKCFTAVCYSEYCPQMHHSIRAIRTRNIDNISC